MYTGLFHTHSMMRYIILAVLILAILKSIGGWMQKSEYDKFDSRLAFFGMLFVHLQIVLGFVMYFLSQKVMLDNMSAAMKVPLIRYYTVEHVSMMLIAAVLITIGRIVSKKKATDLQKHKVISIYYGLSLVLILVTVYVMMPM
jgi:hypothetical protein